jgi:Uncharacterized protein conserved in archaea
MMVLLTLVGDDAVKEGHLFYFMGSQPECEDCKLKTICMSLEEGTLYKVIAVRKQTHDCALTEHKVRVTEIEKVPQDVLVPKKFAIEGSLMTFQEIDCKKLDCDNYLRCHPPGIKEGRKYSIVALEGNAKCQINEKLVHAKLM